MFRSSCPEGRLVVRSEREDWTSRIQRLHTAAFADRSGFSGTPWLFEADWQRAVHADGYTLAVVEEGPRVLGYALAFQSQHASFPPDVDFDRPLPPDWLATGRFLLWIGVDPQVRRQRIGTCLLRLTLSGVAHGALYVDEDNDGAENFYRKRGWWPAGRAGSQRLWIFDRRPWWRPSSGGKVTSVGS